MTKKNQNVYKHAISWLRSIGYTDDKIISELEIDETTLKQCEDNEKPDKAPKKEPMVKKLMTSSTGNKNNKITVMSKEASELSDSLKNQESKKRDTSSFIFKPNNS